MAHVRFANWVREQIAEALAKGAKRARSIRKLAFPPTTAAPICAAGLRRRRSPMSLMREESFGPVVGIMKVAATKRRSS
jgi:acyl-CoA reductase-like NAD-dependent aldehyde dehydrogenase